MPTVALILAACSIEGRQILANGAGCLLRRRPVGRLIAGDPFVLVDVRLDQARVDRECLAADEARHDADRHHPLEHAAQDIALSEALMPGA